MPVEDMYDQKSLLDRTLCFTINVLVTPQKNAGGRKADLIFFMLHQNVQGLAHKLLIC